MHAHAACVDWLARLQLRLADGVELRPHWRMDVYMPEVEGCAWRPFAPLVRAVHSWVPGLPMPFKAWVSVLAHFCWAPDRRLGSAAREGEDGVRVERGHCHITVPRVDLVLPLDALARRARQLTARGRILPEPGEAPAERRTHCWLLSLQCANECARTGQQARSRTAHEQPALVRWARQRLRSQRHQPGRHQARRAASSGTAAAGQ